MGNLTNQNGDEPTLGIYDEAIQEAPLFEAIAQEQDGGVVLYIHNHVEDVDATPLTIYYGGKLIVDKNITVAGD